ncbi:hypothetical protein M4D68_00695 [Priestia aryabhattai]|uniref:hypothetical protein n=1 Tax=Priestia aryabhattai TaxID=412384 RepID=UPI00203F46E6|nr:hypothetical protein [Priestia aryabhattai]MCM3639664.1 hypothetical protein [Priestia aryabhattai]
MKVIIKGMEITNEMLTNKLNEVADSTVERVMKETGATIENYSIKEAEITLQFMVEGMDEPQVLTVEHHEGQREMLTWVVDMDEETELSNEEESLFDKYSASIAKGEQMKFEEIKSEYNLIDLEEDKEMHEKYSDMEKKVYDHKDGFKVVRVFYNKKLIQEYKLVPKESDAE